MTDRTSRFTTYARKTSRNSKLSWGGANNWGSQIEQNDGITITGDSVGPSGIPGPTDGLVAYYPFKTADGADRVGEYDSTVHGATYRPDSGPQSTGAYSFNGSSNYLTLPEDPVLEFTTAHTITVWLHTERSTKNMSLVSKWTDETNDHRSIITAFQDGTLRYGLDPTGDYSTNTNVRTSQLPTGTWLHAAFVFDGSTMSIYANGSLEVSTAHSDGIYDTPAVWTIGAISEGVEWNFDGFLTGARLYNVALSEAEITTLYEETK